MQKIMLYMVLYFLTCGRFLLVGVTPFFLPMSYWTGLKCLQGLLPDLVFAISSITSITLVLRLSEIVIIYVNYVKLPFNKALCREYKKKGDGISNDRQQNRHSVRLSTRLYLTFFIVILVRYLNSGLEPRALHGCKKKRNVCKINKRDETGLMPTGTLSTLGRST